MIHWGTIEMINKKYTIIQINISDRVVALSGDGVFRLRHQNIKKLRRPNLKSFIDMIFCKNIFLEKAGYLCKIRAWYLSNTTICCHSDRHTIKKIIPGGLIWSKMMNTCMVYMAIQFPLDGIHWCLCFILWGEGNADLLEREKATAEWCGVITSLSFEMSLS